MYGDLDAVNNDAKIFVTMAQRFRFKYDRIHTIKQLSNKDYVQIVKKLHQDFRKTPQDIVLIFCVFASHGMIQCGRQTILINEFDKATGFYKLIGAEENIRSAAQRNSNAYFVCIFACCREILLRKNHSGGMSLEEANKKM